MNELIKKRNELKNKKGFTLVEVIVVLVILAIMAAILVPSMIGWINKANDKTALVEARSVLLASQTIASEHYEDFTAAAVTEADDSTFVGEVEDLADVDGTVTSLIVDKGGTVKSFTYTPAKGKVITYASKKFTVAK